MARAGLMLVAVLALPPSSAAGQVSPPPPRHEAFDPVFYFRSGGVEIDPPNEEAWRKIETVMRRDAPDWVEVTAHTDSAGTPEENMRLSARRGQAVARRLAAIGVRPAAIRIVACGEHRLAVETGDGVVELLNGRATVDWGRGKRELWTDPSCRALGAGTKGRD